MIELLDNNELAIENFTLSARNLVTRMEQQQRIFGAGFPPMGGGPTQEQRDASDEEWERLYTELKNVSVNLFKEVGGQHAYTVWEEVCKHARRKNSFDRFLDNDPKFIGDILIGSSGKQSA